MCMMTMITAWIHCLHFTVLCVGFTKPRLCHAAKVQINFGFSVPEEGTLTIEETIA